ncbi:protein Skeletor, isoforms B/C-like [Amblyomma americanum]
MPEHCISGAVYVASESAFYLVDFSYDGRGTGAFFWAGDTSTPDGRGEALPDENGTYRPLARYDKKTIIIRLENSKTIRDYRYLAVYCPQSSTILAHVKIPAGLDYPKPAIVATHVSGAHNTSVKAIVVEDKKTLVLRSFYYDASASDAYFLVGKEGASAGRRGAIVQKRTIIRTGRPKEYTNAHLSLTLPGNATVDDIDWFSVHCANCAKPLIYVRIPKNLNVPPGSVWSPRKKSRLGFLSLQKVPDDPSQFLNCEAIIADKIQVGWHLEADTITFHVRARAMPGTWTAFGVSGAPEKSMMEGADVAVLFIKAPDNQVNVVDFHLTAKAQCSGSSGVCPDTVQGGTDDLTLKKGSYANGILEAVYSRKLTTADSKDKPIPATGRVAVVAAQGPTNKDQPETVLYHTMIYTSAPVLLQFDRSPKRECPAMAGHGAPPPPPSGGPKLFGGRDLFKKYNIDTFTARIGPTAGVNGYEKITGGAGWGIAWWINEELIPILHVERGKTYKFIVEGGTDPSLPSKYHPFYITDSSTGGGSKEEAAKLGKPGHQLYAGVVLDSQNKPNVSKGTGRYCKWEEDLATSDNAQTWEEYKKTLKLECEPGQSGEFTWTPDQNTPNLVYYQCFTHNYLGWKISVTNPGEEDKPLGEVSSEDEAKGMAARGSSMSPLLLLFGCLLTVMP